MSGTNRQAGYNVKKMQKNQHDPCSVSHADRMRSGKVLLALLCVLAFTTMSFSLSGQHYYNVMDYGAVNDGSRKSSEAIKKAIEAAAAQGGGTVFFPAGEYLTGPVYLESNITILIDAGALIKFSDNFDDYLPMVPSRWEGTDVINFSPLFYAYEEENIAIRGRGTIDGQGKAWWDFHHNAYGHTSKWQELFAENNRDVVMPDQPGMIERGFLRPPFIQPLFCKNVLIEGITIINSPFWTINPEYCENVTVTGVTINNPDSPNTDGINPSSCSNVHISDCHITVGDDCITIKSGRDRNGRERAVPAENYTITNCTMLSGHGGVVIGSEMSGGVKKITISNCIFDGTDRGIRIKSMRGRGGTVEEIRVSNVVMKDIRGEAIVLNMHYGDTEPEPVSERTPRFKNIHFSNITAEAHQAGLLTGLDELHIEGITFNNMNIKAKKGFEIKNADRLEFHHVQVDTESGPSLQAEDVNFLEIDGFKSQFPHKKTPVISLKNVTDAYLHSNFAAPGTDLFLQLQGERTRNIVLDNNNFYHVRKIVSQGKRVPEKAQNRQKAAK